MNIFEIVFWLVVFFSIFLTAGELLRICIHFEKWVLIFVVLMLMALVMFSKSIGGYAYLDGYAYLLYVFIALFVLALPALYDKKAAWRYLSGNGFLIKLVQMGIAGYLAFKCALLVAFGGLADALVFEESAFKGGIYTPFIFKYFFYMLPCSFFVEAIYMNIKFGCWSDKD